MQINYKSILVTVFLSLLSVSLGACNKESPKPTADANADAVPVVVGTLQKVQERQRISASGTVSTPKAPANVGFLVPGRVVFAGPREGEYISEGQVLAKLDPLDFTLAVQAAEAQKARAQAEMEKALHSARPEILAQARITFERAEDEYRRMKMLHDEKALAPNDFLKYKAVYEQAQQSYKEAKAGGQKEDKDLAKAGFNQADVQLRINRKKHADATLLAPTSGYISKRLIEPGDTASAGRPVFEIVQMKPMEVNVGVPETDVHLVRIGQEAEITIPALPGKTFQGTVRLINISADPGTRTYMTRIAVENPELLLRVGMVAEATIHGDQTISMMTLPGDAVVRDPQEATQVYVYYPDQKRVYAKRVEIGMAANTEVEIRSRLSGDELIVLAGQTKLRDGLAVSANESRTGRE
jgi:multidrug efflux pump subunit AcrA (membrane-fusion protein)